MTEAQPATRVSPVAAWEALFRAQVTVIRTLSADFPSQTISLTEYDVLYTLTLQPGRRMRIRDLNARTLLTQPSVSRLVDRLTARGLLQKSVDPSDGRGTVVTLTDEGFAVYRSAAHPHGRSITDQMTKALSGDELAQLKHLCDKLRLGVAGEAPTDPCVGDSEPGAGSASAPRTTTEGA